MNASARADTDLLYLQTNASSASGVDCFSMTAAECERIIRDCRGEAAIPSDLIARARAQFNAQFDKVFG